MNRERIQLLLENVLRRTIVAGESACEMDYPWKGTHKISVKRIGSATRFFFCYLEFLKNINN